MARDSAKMTATRNRVTTHFWLCNMMAATTLTMVWQRQETKAEAVEKERPHRLRRGRGSRSGF